MTEIDTSATETDEQTEAGTPPAPESETGSEGRKDRSVNGLAEARDRYRAERDQTREALSAAQARIEQMQTRELERVAAGHLSNPADLLTLSGKTLADFLTEDGELDAEAIAEAAHEVITTRPGLRPNARPVDPMQGTPNNPPPRKRQPTWGDLFDGTHQQPVAVLRSQ